MPRTKADLKPPPASKPKDSRQSLLLPVLWLIPTASIFYLYGELIPKACQVFNSSLTLGEIIQVMSQAKYYYLYLSIPLNIFIFLQIRKRYEFEIMKLRLWMKKKSLAGLGWFLIAAAIVVVFACSLNKGGM